MENFEKRLTKDLRSDGRPLIEIGKSNNELIERAQKELAMLKPTFKDFMSRVTEEKPEVIVFLDKGARILATPFKKYLNELGEDPEFAFFNDTELKAGYLENKSLDVPILDLEGLRGRKTFFIDETFSAGKGAAPLRKAMDQLGLDANYFALSRNPKPLDLEEYSKFTEFQKGFFHQIPMVEHKKNLEEIEQDKRFKIYNNQLTSLFTKDAAEFYIAEDDQGSKGRYKIIPKGKEEEAFDYTPKKGEIPNARAFGEQPENLSWAEYDQKVRELNMATVKKLKEEIYKTLKS